MFFTWIGKVLAYLVFLLGILRVAVGLFVAFGSPDAEANSIAASRYLAAASSGEAINDGMMFILVAVALGVLCEISAKKPRA